MAAAVVGSSTTVSPLQARLSNAPCNLKSGSVSSATWQRRVSPVAGLRANAARRVSDRSQRGASYRPRAAEVEYDSSQEAAATVDEEVSPPAPSDFTIDSFLQQAQEAYSSDDEVAVAAVEAQIRALDADRQGLAEQLDALTAETTLAKDRFLRLNADFDNFRKRSEREKLAMAATVRGEVIESLLPMIDSFERAKSAVKAETESECKIDGAYQGIYKQFVEVMRALGVTAVETVGGEFDPAVHEAIMREESLDFPEGVVTMEFRKGFVIGEKLIRPAMVKVSAGPGPADAAAAAAAQPVAYAEPTEAEPVAEAEQ